MQKRKKVFPYLLISILSQIGLILFVNTLAPNNSVEIANFQVSAIIPFFILMFLIVSGITAFVFAHIKHGLFLGFFTISILLLQYLRYNNLLYSILLVIIVILMEILFWKKK